MKLQNDKRILQSLLFGFFILLAGVVGYSYFADQNPKLVIALRCDQDIDGTLIVNSVGSNNDIQLDIGESCVKVRLSWQTIRRIRTFSFAVT